MVNRDEIMAALKECYDPEIPINIVDLGLVYNIDIAPDGQVAVRMTLTAPGCPASVFIGDQVKRRVEAIAGVKVANVEIVWDPPWTPDKMSDDAKKMMGFGF